MIHNGDLFKYPEEIKPEFVQTEDIVKNETGIPTLIIEHELRGEQTEQLQNRVNVFIEMLN